MATTYTLSNPSVTVATVDFSDNCRTATVNLGFDSLEITAFSDSGRKFAPGLQSVEVTLELFNAYGTGDIEDTLFDILGDGTTTLVIKADPGTVSATNPEYTISNAMLATQPVVSASVGELQTVSVTFTGGTFARSTTP